jgi:plastocyanin
MKKLITALFFIPLISQSQTTHSVTVGSNFFNPNSLTIQVGDQVTWTNTGGSHNVNGTQTTYPANPDSFGNSVGSGWTYSFTFTIPGTYQYRCDPHPSSMQGTITVQGSGVNVEEQIKNSVIRYHHFDPATQQLMLSFENNVTGTVDLFNATGQQISTHAVNGESFTNIPLSSLAAGLYIVRFSHGEGVVSFPVMTW